MILGVIVMFILYLGFPKNWDKFLLFLVGLVIIIVAYRMKPSLPPSGSAENPPRKKEEPPYVDHHSSL